MMTFLAALGDAYQAAILAAVGDQPDAIEIRNEDENENVKHTQKMMAQLNDVAIVNVNQQY